MDKCFFNLLHKRYRNDGIPIITLNNLQLETLNKMRLKTLRGIYKFEKVPCCICKKLNFELLSEKDRHGLYNPVVICKDCGLIQNNPRMNQESYINFYKSEYRRLMYGELEPTKEAFEIEYNRGKNIISFLHKAGVINENSKEQFIFEVGCGSGGILKAFKDQGFLIQGCDLDKEYLEYGKKKYDLNLNYGTLNDISFDRDPDLIIYSHVLEHILHPREELTQIHKVLKKKGYIYVEVPGVKNLIDSCEMNFLFYLHCHHVYHFSIITLTNLLNLSGFRLIKINNFIRSVFKKTEIFESSNEIKSDFNNAIKYLQRLEKLRRLLVIKKTKKKITSFIKKDLTNYENLENLPKFIMNQLDTLLHRYLGKIRILKRLMLKISKKSLK